MNPPQNAAPTFSPSGVERELEAIESEDSKNKLSDGFRLLQLYARTMMLAGEVSNDPFDGDANADPRRGAW